MSYLNRPLSWEDPPNDPDTCDDCGTELVHEVDGDRDEDGNVYAVHHSYCPNPNCPDEEEE